MRPEDARVWRGVGGGHVQFEWVFKRPWQNGHNGYRLKSRMEGD